MGVGHGLVLRRAQVGQQRGHLVEGPPAHGLVVPVAGQVLANALLVVPQQAVQRQHVAVADEGQAVVDRVAGRRVRRDVQEEPAAEEGL